LIFITKSFWFQRIFGALIRASLHIRWVALPVLCDEIARPDPIDKFIVMRSLGRIPLIKESWLCRNLNWREWFAR